MPILTMHMHKVSYKLSVTRNFHGSSVSIIMICTCNYVRIYVAKHIDKYVPVYTK